jgi:hypothetical protein
MSQQNPMIESFAAAGDLSASRYCFVKITAARTVAIAGSAERCSGILQDQPDVAGMAAGVAVGGTSFLKVDGSGTAILAGDMLKSDSSGQGVKTTSANDEIGAQALEASAAAGDEIQVRVIPAQRY